MIPSDDPKLDTTAPEALPTKRRRWRFSLWLIPMAGAACVVLVVAAALSPMVGPVRQTARRAVEASNLRHIAMASILYASDHGDRLPVATDVWDYAGFLAKAESLNDATFWVSRLDPANDFSRPDLTTVLTKDGRELEPQFRAAKLAWAVPLGDIVMERDPSTTPIAWTRGLRSDGTWAPHSPYGSSGGSVAFLGGNVQFYRNLNSDGGQLVRHDGMGKTNNILEALPPGVRIGEYVPTEHEQRDWSRAWSLNDKERKLNTFIAEGVVPLLWVGALLVCVVQAARRRWRWGVVLWFLGLSALLVLFMPMC